MRIHVLRIQLRNTKPPVWRKVAVPSDITLGLLHDVIQIAMGWEDCHLHQFILRNAGPRPSVDAIRLAIDQGNLTGVFLAQMRGERVFVPMSNEFGDLDMDGEDEDTVTLDEVCPTVKSKIVYEYDFGDGWEHGIEVQKIIEPKKGVAYPVCMSGKLACPPDDCGGVWGYYDMLAAIADPKHEEHEEIVEWLGDDFDPERFDIDEVNDILAEWRSPG